MLLRSSSAPIPSSWLPHSKESEPAFFLPRTRSVSLVTSVHSSQHQLDDPVKHLGQSLPETELQNQPKLRKNNLIPHRNTRKNQKNVKFNETEEIEEQKEGTYQKQIPSSIQKLFSSSGLDEEVVHNDEFEAGKKKDSTPQTLVMGGGGMGSNGGRIRGGGGGGQGWDSCEGNNHGRDSTDVYYQKMIEANPDNALLLGNYAKFLKEVRGDYPKAEEYLERAISANPDDGNVLSQYADLIWQTHRNADRAEEYFNKAVKSAPNDCYVLASYAKFLWDAEEDEKDKEDKDCQHKSDHSPTYQPGLFQGANRRLPLTAASS